MQYIGNRIVQISFPPPPPSSSSSSPIIGQSELEGMKMPSVRPSVSFDLKEEQTRKKKNIFENVYCRLSMRKYVLVDYQL